MGDRVTLVRPDGSIVESDVEDADHLRALGYKDQTPEQFRGEAIAASNEAYYTTPGQKVLTGVEGLLSGATLGLSDLALEHGGWSTAERGQHNPGLRLGTELIGGLASLGPLGEFTPVGMLAKGAKGAGAALAEGKAAQTAITTAIEGGGFGAQGVIAHSVISGDPLTAEAITAGVGWGAVFGGGLGYMVGRAGAKLETKAVMEANQAAMLKGTEEAWGSFRGGIMEAAEQTSKTVKAADEIYSTFGKSNAETIVAQVNEARNTVVQTSMLAPDVAGMSARDVANFTSAEAKGFRKAADRAYADTMKAAKAGDFDRLRESAGRFKENVTELAKLTGQAMPEIGGFAAEGAKASANAVEELAKMTSAAEHLKGIPLDPEAFAKLKPANAEKMFAAVDEFMGGSHAELSGVRDGLQLGIERLETTAGKVTDGGPGAKLRGVYEQLHEASKAKALGDTAAVMGGGWKAAVASMAGQTVRGKGGGILGGQAAYHATKALLGVKAMVVGGIKRAVTEWAPRIASKAGPLASRIEPLKVRLDGAEDKGKATRQELMASRSKEIYEAAGSVRDSLYKSVSPLATMHPELAAAMHTLTVKQFSFLMDKLPMDPGLAFNRFKTLWHPDPAAIEKFARFYQVFQNPIAVVQEILKTGRVKPEWAEGLREMHPALFAELRVDMIEKLSDPKVLGSLSYNEQVSLGVLLQIPIHSSMTPQFVATQQQMYMERNQKPPMNAQPGADGGGGRPSGPANSPYSSAGDKVTNH